MPMRLCLALALVAAPVAAQMAAPACKEVSNASLPADLAAWAGEAVAVEAARSGPGTAVPVGAPMAVRLHPSAEVTLGQPPEQERKPANPHAGLLAVEVPEAGTWRLSASTGLWVDIISPNGLVKSTAFGALAPCTSIRKVVEFPLGPGRHTLQLSGNPGPETLLMLSRKP